MNMIDENTVEAENQIESDRQISFEGDINSELRVTFVGNSITRHAVVLDIGWDRDCGMAASSVENDYVHIVIQELRRRNNNVGACICNISRWERDYRNGDGYLKQYEKAHHFKPHIVIMRTIENCPHEDFDCSAFENEYIKLLRLFAPPEAKIILTTSFWKHPGDAVIQRIAEKYGYPCAYLGNYGETPNLKAYGKFKHNGICSHPGDEGMKRIAEDILKIL